MNYNLLMTDNTPADIIIRPGDEADLCVLTDLYNYYIINTHFTFDIEPVTTEDRRINWFSQFDTTGRYRLFVAVSKINNEILGYSSSTRFKNKRAYETSVETTIYLQPNLTRKNIGSRLYHTLFQSLAGEDVHRAYAGVALPNEPSLNFHIKMGFRPVATYHEVGRKFNKFHSVTWLEKLIIHIP